VLLISIPTRSYHLSLKDTSFINATHITEFNPSFQPRDIVAYVIKYWENLPSMVYFPPQSSEGENRLSLYNIEGIVDKSDAEKLSSSVSLS
jgi:hypothetical protein